jgi:hypothetical protein
VTRISLRAELPCDNGERDDEDVSDGSDDYGESDDNGELMRMMSESLMSL